MEWNEEYFKFRVWDKHDGEMAEWKEINENCDIMRYTGCKDKYDREIYEGDLLRGDIGIYKVIRDEKFNTFRYKDINHDCFYPFELYSYRGLNLEVIGNIYENPEILKKYGNENM